MSSKRSRKKSRKGRTDLEKREAKKTAVMEGQKSRAPLVITLIFAAAIVGAGVYMMGGKGKSGPVASSAAQSQSSSGVVSFPVSTFADGKARYYQYNAQNGMKVRYFILKSSDGVIRAAFDACDVCWTARKGYRQEGDNMVCNNCGQRFPSVKVNVIKGGCNPAPLNRTVVGDNLLINVSDILEGGNLYFNFARGRRG